jgi:hypothetical protein
MKKKARKRRALRRQNRLLSKLGHICSCQCSICQVSLFYFDKYDATCCVRCDIWHEDTCDDPNCMFCAVRPEKPSIGLYLSEALFLSGQKAYYHNKYEHRRKHEYSRRLKLSIKEQHIHKDHVRY